MLTAFVKYYFIYFFCIYIYQKSFSICIFTKPFICTCTAILSIMSYFLYSNLKELNYLLPILTLWMIVSIKSSRPQTSFIAISISFIISFSTHAISSMIIAILSALYFESSMQFMQAQLFSFLTVGLQFILIKFFLSIKRLRKGIILLNSPVSVNFVTLLCLLLYGFTLYISLSHMSTWLIATNLISVISLLAFLIYWWQAQITKAYRRNLELRELESMRTEMTELKHKMEELTAENERLARITHRDNTLISALKNATVKYLSTDFEDSVVALETRNQLIENINTLSAGRSSLSENRKEQSARMFETSSSLLNELLHEMDEKAIEMKITFAVHMGTALDNFIPDAVSESDLVHTVDDLLKNAFKATANCEKRVVQLQFYKLGKHFVIEVADSGIPFEEKSLVNMGIEKLTTYEDGSGIGLMDIWSTKEKYGATYHLDECVNADPFTKKISLTFDKKNRYSIRTLRKNEILQMSRRADLQVYDYNE